MTVGTILSVLTRCWRVRQCILTNVLGFITVLTDMGLVGLSIRCGLKVGRNVLIAVRLGTLILLMVRARTKLLTYITIGNDMALVSPKVRTRRLSVLRPLRVHSRT